MKNRTKAWRRYQDHIADVRHENRKDFYSVWSFGGEKKWKMMYGRSQKIYRAKKLGFEYPTQTTYQLLDA